MKPATVTILLYIGYAVGSLQVLAFRDKYEILGVLVGVSILLIIIAGVANSRQAKKSAKTILRRSSAKKRSKTKSSAKVVKS